MPSVYDVPGFRNDAGQIQTEYKEGRVASGQLVSCAILWAALSTCWPCNYQNNLHKKTCPIAAANALPNDYFLTLLQDFVCMPCMKMCFSTSNLFLIEIVGENGDKCGLFLSLRHAAPSGGRSCVEISRSGWNNSDSSKQQGPQPDSRLRCEITEPYCSWQRGWACISYRSFTTSYRPGVHFSLQWKGEEHTYLCLYQAQVEG